MSGKRFLVTLFFLFLIFLIFPLVNAVSEAEVNIALYHLTPKQELCRCEAFNYNFIVFNTGSLDETFSFSVSRYAPNFNISPSIVKLGPKETANIGIGARIPCSVTQPNIDFIARTKNTSLKVKTPLQLSVNSSCYAPDINITGVRALPKEVKALSALFVFLMLLVVILLFVFILQQRPEKGYWWSSYFKARPERKTTVIEIVTIIIVVVFLLLIGLRGLQQIGRNETLITTYMGPENVTQPIRNITIKPVFEKVGETVGKGMHVFSRIKQFFWPYKVYILIGLILLILIIVMSIIIIRKRKAKPKKIEKMLRIKQRYIIIALVILFLLALIAASAFLLYKYRSKIMPFLSQIITKLRLGKVKDFLLPKLIVLLGFLRNAFDFVMPYLIYVIIGIVLLVVIIIFLRRREKMAPEVVSVIEKKPKKKIPEKRRKKKKREKAAKKTK